MSIPREFIDLLLTKIDLVDVVNTRVHLRKKTGSNFFACCPFHQEKSASFSVSQTKQFYYCFGCGAHGNAIDFLIQHDRLTFKESVEALAREVGMELPTKTNEQKNDTLPALFDLMKTVTEYFYSELRNAPHAIEYLKKRGISGSIAKQFQIGYAKNEWHSLTEKYGKNPQEQQKLLEAGLIIKKNDGGFYDRFRDRIIFPIQDYRGRIIGFGGRIIDQGEPKYLNSPETILFQKGHELYGLYHVLKANREIPKILVVEGYMDVIALFQHNITFAVATLGTSTTTHHLERLFRYTSQVIFCFDGDQAGRTAAWRALQVIFPLMQDNWQIKFLFLPDGEDPDSLIRKENKLAFESRIENSINLSQFFFQTLIEKSDLSSIEGRSRFAKAALNQIKKLPNCIFQSILIEELCKRARLNPDEIKSQFRNSTEHSEITFTPITSSDRVKMKMPTPVRLILSLLIQHPQLADLINEPLGIIEGPGFKFLTQLIEILKINPEIRNTGALLEYFRGQKEAAYIAKLMKINMIPEAGIENEFLGALKQLRLLQIEQQISELLNKASQQGLTEIEKTNLKNWISQKQQINQQ